MRDEPRQPMPSSLRPRSAKSSEITVPEILTTDAMRLGINVLRDLAESHKMHSGVEADQATADLHTDAAEAWKCRSLFCGNLNRRSHGLRKRRQGMECEFLRTIC